jgi:hypothetical protein
MVHVFHHCNLFFCDWKIYNRNQHCIPSMVLFFLLVLLFWFYHIFYDESWRNSTSKLKTKSLGLHISGLLIGISINNWFYCKATLRKTEYFTHSLIKVDSIVNSLTFSKQIHAPHFILSWGFLFSYYQFQWVS